MCGFSEQGVHGGGARCIRFKYLGFHSLGMLGVRQLFSGWWKISEVGPCVRLGFLGSGLLVVEWA